jgi:hypothetical protein
MTGPNGFASGSGSGYARRFTSGLVSWPVAFACARERLRQGPLWVLGLLVAAQGLTVKGEAAGAQLFGSLMGPLSLLLFSLFLGAGLVSEELESGHAQLVLLRPLTRAEWFGGRLAGAGMVLLAAMGLAWIFGLGTALREGAGVSSALLLSLPLAFIWVFAWLATLAAVSVVARGWSNAGWMVIGFGGWGALYWFTRMGHGLFKAASAQKEAPVFDALVAGLKAIEPYVGPRSPGDLLAAVQMGAPADWSPLLYDLLWAAAAWLVGAVLVNRRELARRRP